MDSISNKKREVEQEKEDIIKESKDRLGVNEEKKEGSTDVIHERVLSFREMNATINNGVYLFF